MSKVRLVVVEGHGSEYSPWIGGTDRIINLDLELPETHSIAGIIREDFIPEKDGSVRAGADITPVIEIHKVNNLVGKLLTLIDATFIDKEQRNAMKDLFKQIPWDWYQSYLDGPRTTWRKDKGYEQ